MWKLFLIGLAVACFGCTNSSVEPLETPVEKTTPPLRIHGKQIEWNKKNECSFEQGGQTFLGKAKFRGGSSSKYAKHSFTIDLKEKRSFCGLPKSKHWILNASYIDKTFQRHKISYDLFRAMNPKNKASKCGYLPVFHEDSYEGLYVVMEKVEASWLGWKSKTHPDAALFKDPLLFFEEYMPNVQDSTNYYGQKFPKQKKRDYTTQMDALRDFLFHASDAEFESKIGSYFDLNNIIEWQLLLMFTNNHDGLYKNFYIFRENQEAPFQIIPWDYDHSFGRDCDYGLNLIDRPLGWEKMILFKRLMATKNLNYPQRLKKRYFELRNNGIFSEKYVRRLISENDALIQPFIEKNAKRWPMDATWYSDANDYDQEIQIMFKFLPLRIQQLDQYFKTL